MISPAVCINYEMEVIMFERNKPLVGIDIGTHSIKLVHLKKSGKNYHLLNFGVMPLKPESIVDGAIMNAGAVVEGIRNLVRMEKVKTKEVATAISGQSVIVKKIRVSQMTEKELADSISWEAEQHIPFEISDVNIDFQIMPPPHEGQDVQTNQMDVLLVAAKKTKMDDYTSLLLEAGLCPVVVDIDVFALENEYEINHAQEGGVVALVDIGASAMNINILKHGITMFQRDMSCGGNRYNAVLQREFGISYDEAEALKMGVGFSDGRGAEQVVPLLVSVSEEIGAELQRSFEFFRTTTPEVPINKMVLSGGCARMKGLARLLSTRLGLPVEVADPFRNIHYSGKVFDPEYLQEMAPVAAVGVGLALRRMND
jgi:type IV pilus assembly protein PilM